MAKMRREISYYEAKPGVFERAPTRAEKRKAEKAREARAERIRNLLAGALIIACAGVYIWAHYVWATLPRI